MYTAFVTGASRGLGLSLVEAVLQRPDSQVVMGIRTMGEPRPLSALRSRFGDRVREVRLDYSDEQSIVEAVEACHEKFTHLDLLVNCGAVSNTVGDRPVEACAGPVELLEGQALADQFQANVVGPILLSQRLLPLLRKATSAALINVSSLRGSHAAAEAGSIGYSVTKAALNMASRKFAAELAADPVGVVSIHPGWMRTRMGGDQAPLTTEEVAADLMLHIVPNAIELNGCFVDRFGENIPW